MEVFTSHQILKKRILLGYSQEYMAFNLGISQQAYSKIERGLTNVKLNHYIKIVSILENTTYNIL